MNKAKGLLLVCALVLSACVQSRAMHKIEWVDKPCIRPYKDYNYNTCSDLKVKVDGQLVVVPRGFETDLASIPKVLWPVFSPQYAPYVYPAILHDFFYRCPDNVTRKYADDVFYSALIEQGVSTWTATRFWIGVRTFGGSHFNNMDNCKYNYYYEAEVDNKVMKS